LQLIPVNRMRNDLTLGSLTREHRATTLRVVATGDAQRDLADLEGLEDLDRVATPTLIDRLLLPQHVVIRACLTALRATAADLAQRDGSRAHILQRAARMLDELTEIMLDHFDHEERVVFPFLSSGAAPVQILGQIHDHHDDIDDRLRRMRALTVELRSGDEVTDDVVVLFEGLCELDTLACRHHALERHTLLARYR